MTRSRLAALPLGCALAVIAVPSALGDIDPVRISVAAPARVTVGKTASITVTVDADKGAFDSSSAPITVRAKLAHACGGDFDGTNGLVAVDAPLTPQPAAGAALHAIAKGKRKLTKRSTYDLCVFVTDADGRQFASDIDNTITVRKAPKKH